jgi:hypothetical protein
MNRRYGTWHLLPPTPSSPSVPFYSSSLPVPEAGVEKAREIAIAEHTQNVELEAINRLLMFTLTFTYYM